ncbi:hypothetical protein ACUNV4_24005 [Granulosicoccus sp. 3-233]|uniref:hypothetical protein n=1 Tax=Granulosicoccus sp. 3-233 TaxID=3417969 RepID=UPI003D33AA6E
MTDSSLFSEHWYRVKGLMPALAPDVRVVRHVYRLQPSYILRRASTRSWHRIGLSAYELLAQFNGRRTVEEIWEAGLASQGEAAASQGELITLLGQLHEADLLVVDARLDAEEILGRRDRMRKRDSGQRFMNPLYLRLRLLDPDRLVSRIDRLIPRHCFVYLASATGLLWVFALYSLLPHWDELSAHLGENRYFNPVNVLLLAVLYPVLKVMHELAHALVVKRYGGEVRECGLALLVLVPNPYVDASAANMFASKYQRMLVSAAGILVEISLAAMAALVWLNSTGLVQDAALSVMLIGLVSTLLFNGNPLLKFDGYYLLADWLEIPNLAARSRQYLLGRLATMLGASDDSPITLSDSRERWWLIAYGLLSSVYRVALMFFIAWMISGQYHFFGVLLALHVFVVSLALPAWKAVRFIGRQAQDIRRRVVFIVAVLLCLSTSLAVALPLPKVTVADGIVWLPEQAVLRIAQPCEVTRLYVTPGSEVLAGARLFDCIDDQRRADVLLLEADLRRLDAQRAGLLLSDPVEHQNLVFERRSIQTAYDLAVDRLQQMQVRAGVAGRFLVEGSVELEGRYLAANAVAGYVVPGDNRTIRLALEQEDHVWLRDNTVKVDVLLDGADSSRQAYSSRITRQTPKASHRVATAALTTLGGGDLPAEALEEGVRVQDAVFDLELAWPENASSQAIGSRVRVRFDHGSATLLNRLNVFIRQLWLERESA